MKTEFIRNMICACVLLATVAACSADVDFGEQYRKTVYIVGSRDMLHEVEHFYETENDRAVISVYCASTEAVRQDLTVTLAVNPHALDSLNARRRLENPMYRDKVMLPASHCRLPDALTVVVRAGRQYGTLEIPVSLTGLDADSAFVLPFSIVSNSEGFAVNPELQHIVYGIKPANRFSGDYAGSSVEAGTAIRSVQPLLKAMSARTLRMPVHNLDAADEYLDTNFMLLTVAADNAVSIAPWKDADVTDAGGSFYDPALQSFELHYRYGTTDVVEKIANILAPKVE